MNREPLYEVVGCRNCPWRIANGKLSGELECPASEPGNARWICEKMEKLRTEELSKQHD
jgi:hypothetical protein